MLNEHNLETESKNEESASLSGSDELSGEELANICGGGVGPEEEEEIQR